jgi:hypothetical protein
VRQQKGNFSCNFQISCSENLVLHNRYSLTNSWYTVHRGKLIFAALFRIISPFYVTRRFITVFIRAHNLSLSHMIPVTILLFSIIHLHIIFSSTLRSPNGAFPSGFRDQNFVCISDLSPCVLHASHFSLFILPSYSNTLRISLRAWICLPFLCVCVCVCLFVLRRAERPSNDTKQDSDARKTERLRPRRSLVPYKNKKTTCT